MRNLRFLLAALAAGALAAGPLAGAAGAGLLAPTYQSSDPEDGAMMDHPPSEVTVTFSEPLDASSQMSVFDECGTEIDSGAATVNVNEMQVGIGKTPAGTYKVVYTAVGLAGVTGQTKGSFDFMVHHGQPCKKGGGGHDHNPGKGKGKGKGHGDHDDKGEHDHDGDGDEDHDSMGPSHSSGTHSSGSTHGGGHGSDHGSGQDKHAEHQDGGNGPADGPTAAAPNPPVASGPGGVAGAADAQAMLVGLGLALLVGVLGGWLLRNSGGLAGPA
ncbi:MAG TPA: copper resistance CopC family protein [Actinomycetota bacterium]|nr:copper resistance CopC family protein [Actinomycetota bacterium]